MCIIITYKFALNKPRNYEYYIARTEQMFLLYKLVKNARIKEVTEDMNKKENIVKIKWIEFENLETGLKVERIKFFDNITLLVGLSGAGKTQILDAIVSSLMLALDKIQLIQPYTVCIGIDINEHIYEWTYTVQKHKVINGVSFDTPDEYFFVYESLLCDQNEIFVRDNDKINIKDFSNIPTPRKDKSLIYQYSDDLHFRELVNGIKNLYNIDMDLTIRRYFAKDSVEDFKNKINRTFKVKPTTNIKIFSHLPAPLKLYIAKIHYSDIFEKILETVKDIFPEIENIDIVEDLIKDRYGVQITVYGRKLYQEDISNGILKSIYFIIELYTASENSLILIDEFENGLGMNCITALSDLLMEESSQLQFIITSHHPKIIGNIDYNNWKIIEREKNIIKNFDCNDDGYEIGGNRHDAYFKLLDKWKFEGKI